jgi:putative secreted protein
VRTLTQCVKPVSQGVIALPATADTQLRLVNPDASEAAVDLTLYGADGEIQSLGARGIALAAHQERTIALSILTSEATPVGVAFKASRGRAAVMAVTQTQTSATASAPSQLGTSHLIPGVPAGATSTVVVLANPGETRATANLTAFGTTPAYQPQGGGNISIPAHSSVSVPLENALLGEASAIQVSSDEPVMAGLSFTLGDAAQVAPVTMATSLVTFTAPGGVLQLTNPGQAEVQATVTATGAGGAEETSTVSVGAGQTAVHSLPAGADLGQRVVVESAQPLFGAVVSSGDNGSWAAPLEQMGSGGVPPLEAELDPELH